MNESQQNSNNKPIKPRLYPLTWDDAMDAAQQKKKSAVRKSPSTVPFKAIHKIKIDPVRPPEPVIPDRMSREAFQALVKQVIKYHIQHPLQALWRFRSFVLFVLGVISVLCEAWVPAAFFLGAFLLNWIITGIVSMIRLFMNLANLFADWDQLLSVLKKLPIIRRLHDFNWSAKVSFLVPAGIFFAGAMGNAFYFQAHPEYRGSASGVLPMSLAVLFATWVIVVVPLLCWFRKGNPETNRYGAAPKEDLQTDALKNADDDSASHHAFATYRNICVSFVKKHKFPSVIAFCVVMSLLPLLIARSCTDTMEYSEKEAQQILSTQGISLYDDNAAESAVRYDLTDRLTLLICARAYSVSSADKLNSLLILSAQKNSPECMKLLLKAGADVHARASGYMGETALHWAAVYGNDRCIEILLDAGAHVDGDKQNSFGGHTPLYYAVDNNRIRCVELLIDAGANVNTTDYRGRKLLSTAMRKGYLQCVKLLKDAGAEE
ncbi:MAG: ankyrin repeat domain-containing protein [Akkermansia sp.]|nr:ankyrin repeat domain-containing protein [Akkermansia sp.]